MYKHKEHFMYTNMDFTYNIIEKKNYFLSNTSTLDITEYIVFYG